MIQGTTVPCEQVTKRQLFELKNHPAETWDQLLSRLILKYKDEDEDLLTEDDILEIKQSMIDLEQGNYVTQAQMKKKLGI